jgi:uncharacterized membrane protein
MDLQRLLRHAFAPSRAARKAFPEAALARIETAIRESERRHGGQIRFAVEASLPPIAIWRKTSAAERALEVFSALRVWDTEQNNGVLLYLLVADHDIEIVADRGIHGVVGAPAWETICRAMESHFRARRFEQGVIEGIGAVSRHLEAHFPRSVTGNELPDRPVVL